MPQKPTSGLIHFYSGDGFVRTVRGKYRGRVVIGGESISFDAPHVAFELPYVSLTDVRRARVGLFGEGLYIYTPDGRYVFQIDGDLDDVAESIRHEATVARYPLEYDEDEVVLCTCQALPPDASSVLPGRLRITNSACHYRFERDSFTIPIAQLSTARVVRYRVFWHVLELRTQSGVCHRLRIVSAKCPPDAVAASILVAKGFQNHTPHYQE